MARPDDRNISRGSVPEFAVGAFFLAAGLGLLAVALLWARLPPGVAHLSYYISGLLLVPGAGFLSAAMTAYARRRGRLAPRGRGWRPARRLPRILERPFDLTMRAWSWLRGIDWVGDWLAVAGAFAICVAALYALTMGWRTAAASPSLLMDELAAGILLLSAFALLVLERKYAAMPEQVLPEAPALSRLCRLPLLGALGLAATAGIRWLGLSFATPLERALAVIAGLVAAEIALRSAVHVFMPLAPIAVRRSHAVSTVAGLIQAKIPNARAFNASVRSQFGIDLARSWSLGFLRRALLPLLLGMAAFSWLLTGITALEQGERAIYESFGQPRAVLHPGLHLHWPWPFGSLRPVEYGTVRQITIDSNAGEVAPQPSSATNIEGDPPPSSNRLWDSSSQEGSYLVADLSNGAQSFEAADIDITIVYRIGLSDQAAMLAAYRVAAPDAAVQAVCGQMLARYFAGNTIENVLGQNREAFVGRFQKELQARLTALSAGIEIMAVVVEGIHPPPKAAASYQGVQAAAIDSATKVSTARAEAAREMKMASVVANATRNDAISAAAERVGKARVDLTLFDGERKAYAAGGAAFLLERRLDRLSRGLADKPLIVVDHRIPAAAVPTLDMRQPERARSGFGDPGAD
ncbi:MAG TPA: SPFH domain-containing protein [Rhizomicrobium sp.]|nr:SPFH domain-containing protein [Rhizomicrobium sp.]